MVKCVVSGCLNRKVNDNREGFNRTPKRFFNFPKDPARVKVWLAALRETDKQGSTDQQLICEDHFLSEDVSSSGVSSDAIPIMPPYLDEPLGLITPWGSSEDEEEDEEEDVEDGGGDDAPLQQVAGGGLENPTEMSSARLPQMNPTVQSRKVPRADVSLGVLTRRFLQLLLEAPRASVDLRQVTTSLQTRKRRVYDITNVLDGIKLIEKESTNRIRWIGRYPVSRFLQKNNNRLQTELENLKLVEATLDILIKSCSQQLFNMTDDEDNSALAYVTHEDISRLQTFHDQMLIVVKAPEETKLQIPVPTEESVQVHLKAGRGPIVVLTCEVASGDAVTSDPTLFLTLEDSRIRMTHTDTQTV